MARARHVIVAVVVGVLALAGSAHAVPSRNDPANVAGRWNYRTHSNCSSVEGSGFVRFTWNPRAGGYDESGWVSWTDSNSTISWQGVVRYLATKRTLEGRLRNSLGDDVDGRWSMEGWGPDRLVVSWRQTNGCTGVGVATREARWRR